MKKKFSHKLTALLLVAVIATICVIPTAAIQAVPTDCVVTTSKPIPVSVSPINDMGIARMPIGLSRGLEIPTNFWNIASKGIYNGVFSKVYTTIYTNYLFDSNGQSYYYVRLNVTSDEGANTTYKLLGYCRTCKDQLIVKSEDIIAKPTDSTYTSYKMPCAGHEQHNFYPAIEQTGKYRVSGTIDVNYTNTWK